MEVVTQGSSRGRGKMSGFGEQGQDFDVSTALEKGSIQRQSSGLLKGRQTPWPCGFLHLLVKEVRGGMIKLNSYNLTFLFKS